MMVVTSDTSTIVPCEAIAAKRSVLVRRPTDQVCSGGGARVNGAVQAYSEVNCFLQGRPILNLLLS